jgi:hypothetical protein
MAVRWHNGRVDFQSRQQFLLNISDAAPQVKRYSECRCKLNKPITMLRLRMQLREYLTDILY